MRRTLSSVSDLWLQSWPTRLTPLVDVVCIAGAGAGASRFKPWQMRLPGFCALHVAQLPGRENRIDEDPIDDMALAVEHLVTALRSQLDLGAEDKQRPLVLFGHSMGAVLAFDVAVLLAGLGIEPDLLVMSATTPPRGKADRAAPDDDELKELLLAFDPENQALVEDSELFASLAPTLRSDFQMLRGRQIEAEHVLAGVPAHLMWGMADPVVAKQAVHRWQAHLSIPAQMHGFDGGHQFPFRQSLDAVTGFLSDRVTDLINQRML